MRNISFKSKLMAGGILVSLIPLIVVSLISLNRMSSNMHANAKKQAQLLARSTAGMVQMALTQEQATIRALASDSTIAGWVNQVNQAGIAASEEIALRLDKKLKRIFSHADSHYDAFFVTDARGKVISGSRGAKARRKGVTEENTDFFKGVKSTGKSVIGTPYLSKMGNNIILIVAAPLTDDAGRFLGMFASSININNLSEKITETRVGKTGYPFMVDKEGKILVHPNPKRLLKYTADKLIKALSGKDFGLAEYTLKGLDKISGFALVPVTGWHVVFTQNQDEFMAPIHKLQKIVIAFMVLFLFLTVALVSFFTRRIMAQLGKDPSHISRIAGSIAQGNLKVDFNAKPSENTGVFASMREMTQNLIQMIRDILTGVDTLNTSSGQLSVISNKMTETSVQTSERASSVAAAAEEMTANMNGVAAATEQTSANLHMIVAAVEEMSSTIAQISKDTAGSMQTTTDAVREAELVSRKVSDLDHAAAQINKVTEAISEISEQTNLLALNATIEAARAGSAGKGFAVVAGEIKELAQQTAGATGKIGSQIGAIQSTTRDAVSMIKGIVEVIDSINASVTSVAAAIEEQSATTQEISSNVSQAASGVKDVNANVNQSSLAAQEVSKDIQEISLATEDLKTNASQIDSSVQELAGLAGDLDRISQQFTI